MPAEQRRRQRRRRPCRYPVEPMRLSRSFVPTLREDPAEAEIASHRLLLRGGFVRQVMSGVYTILPLGLRTMRKIETVVREEMDAAGSIELRMPIVLPADPWRATGRYDLYGDTLFKLTDRHDRDLILGPTQEEVVALMAAADLPSYRDLPKNVYQVEWKYRDEFRPRFGMLRVREFLMKDAYSIDRDEDGMRESYRIMYEAYERIFDRLGLDTAIVEADPGQIGGGVNHEFLARASVGEDLFVECENGDYRADTEAARPQAPEPAPEGTAAAHRGRHARHADDRVPGGAAERGAVADAEVRDVRRGRHDDGGPGARRPRGQRGQAREARVPREGPAVRRRRLRRARVREGVRRTAGLRRRRAGVRGRHGARRERLGDRVEHEGSPRHGRERGPRLPRGPLGGPRRVPRGRSLPDRRRRAAHRACDRARAHLPAGDEVLGAARRDVRGRGRRRRSRT